MKRKRLGLLLLGLGFWAQGALSVEPGKTPHLALVDVVAEGLTVSD